MSIRFGRSGNGYDSSEVMETEDDDWRQITDLSQRRKIQNRLAQRNYRRKLRQRLEELERQAERAEQASSSANSASIPTSNKRTKNSLRSQNGTITAASKEPISDNCRSAPQSLEERLASLEALVSANTSIGAIPQTLDFTAPAAVTTSNLAPGDFGPLFKTLDFQAGLAPWLPQTQQPQYSQARPGVSSFYPPQDSIPSHAHTYTVPQKYPGDPTIPSNPDVSTSLYPMQQSQISSYISVPTDSHLQFPLSFTHTISSPTSILSTSTQQRQLNRNCHLIDTQPFPALPPSYSSNPTINPNPYHINPPLPRDEFYLTIQYVKFYRATITIAQLLRVREEEMFSDDAISTFNRAIPAPPLPENAQNLEPTRKQLEIQHHPYIDVIPFPGFRDKLLDYVKRGEETGDYVEEDKICSAMHDWGVWGEVPWAAQSWEIGESFARDWWFLMDDEMHRCTNWWRLQRGLPPLPKRGKILGEA
ncbi:hypothetical protein RUND412_004066 [Rhizina undulata]